MRTADIAIGGGRSLSVQQRAFHGSARGATDATGTALWPTALPLLLWLQGTIPDVQSQLGLARPLRVLELGAGCGLLGMGLAATCGADVLLTESGCSLGDDYQAGTSLTWLEQNVELNRNTCERDGGRVSTAKLAWGVDADMEAVKSRYPDGFDLLVASDVMYDSQRYPELWTTLTAFAGSSPEARGRQTTHALPPLDAAGLEEIASSAVAILGYQIRNGAERRFGDDCNDFVVARADLPQTETPPEEVNDSDEDEGAEQRRGRNPTGKSVACVLRRGE